MVTALDPFRRDRHTGTFRGWLWTIAPNKIKDHSRNQREDQRRPVARTLTSSCKRLR